MVGVRMLKAKAIAWRRFTNRKQSNPWWYESFGKPNQDWIEKDLHRFRKTTKVCSCVMCGNPRKYFGELTMQEKRASGIGDWEDEVMV